MPDSDTLTIRLPAETKKQLGQLAARVNRTKAAQNRAVIAN